LFHDGKKLQNNFSGNFKDFKTVEYFGYKSCSFNFEILFSTFGSIPNQYIKKKKIDFTVNSAKFVLK